jgi:D-threonate/D-erythronate kinase
MVSIGVVADDLTSAMDGAGPFVAHGLRAEVVLRVDRLSRDEAALIALDADTRRRSAPDAAARTGRAVAALAACDILYKTVDSTLRGHLAAELEAALKSSGRSTAVLAPAFPAEGRITRGGRQLLHGELLESTAFARDPEHPVRSSEIAALLDGMDGLELMSGENSLRRRWRACRVAICDAASDDDLDRIVGSVPLPSALWVGSPGIAAALARAVPQGTYVPSLPQVDRVVIAVGSRHPSSRAQIATLAEAAATLTEHPSRTGHAWGHRVTVLSTPVPTVEGDLLPGLASAVATSLRAAPNAALIATGGSTARAVLEALDEERFLLMGELEPGVPIAACLRSGSPIVTKAGGFGDPETLVRLASRLLGAESLHDH